MSCDVETVSGVEMPDMPRRRFLAIAATGVAMSGMASAQVVEFNYDDILPFIWDAAVVRDLVLQPDLNEEQTMHYVGRDFHSRTGLVAAANLMGPLETREQAARYLDGLAGLSETQFAPETLASQMQVIEGLLREGLPLVPKAGSVQPVRLALVEPLRAIPPDDRAIFRRIVADTLEIDPDDLPDSQALEDSAQVNAMLDEMLVDTEEEDWPALTPAAEQLLRASATPARLSAIRGSGRPRVLYNLAVNCVPLIGWTYMSARLVAGIRRNRHRFSFG
jgi:hypothetical protein